MCGPLGLCGALLHALGEELCSMLWAALRWSFAPKGWSEASWLKREGPFWVAFGLVLVFYLVELCSPYCLPLAQLSLCSMLRKLALCLAALVLYILLRSASHRCALSSLRSSMIARCIFAPLIICYCSARILAAHSNNRYAHIIACSLRLRYAICIVTLRCTYIVVVRSLTNYAPSSLVVRSLVRIVRCAL
jgi:hypothetical protein